MQRVFALFNIFSSSVPPPAAPNSPSDASSSLVLFGSSQAWNNSIVTWQSVTDQVRGGASTAFLTASSESDSEHTAIFSGHLDTSTLGGAGFASVTTKPSDTNPFFPRTRQDSSCCSNELIWDLSLYDGIELVLGAGDKKRYALTIKDEVPSEKRDDGREKAGISWEAEFNTTESATMTEERTRSEHVVWLPWKEFKPTYRGRDQKDAPPLKTEHARRFGLLMRSFFDEQHGDFSLEIKSIAAKKST